GLRIVKVLDFGVSKVTPASNELERTLTGTGQAGVLGTPAYMSPEHILDPRGVDGRADIWSLGVLMYRLLSSRYPFQGYSSPEVYAAILRGRPLHLRDLDVAVPEAVDELIGRCLTFSREDRFPDVGALATAVAPFASPEWKSYAERVSDVTQHTPAQAAL